MGSPSPERPPPAVPRGAHAPPDHLTAAPHRRGRYPGCLSIGGPLHMSRRSLLELSRGLARPEGHRRRAQPSRAPSPVLSRRRSPLRARLRQAPGPASPARPCAPTSSPSPWARPRRSITGAPPATSAELQPRLPCFLLSPTGGPGQGTSQQTKVKST
jgi:hypothetical protein